MDGKLNIGMKAPDFIASDQNNNQIQLYDYLGKYIVIYFFPKAFTPGWTREACGFRDHFESFLKQDVVVLGVSYDSPEKLRSFQVKHELPFLLISDKTKKISKLYGTNGFFFPKRKTILINPEGNIEYIFDKVNIDTHPKDIMKLIQLKRDPMESNNN